MYYNRNAIETAAAWLAGRENNMSRTRGSCWTNGHTIYSYGMPLAEWRDGEPTLLYESRTGHSQSTQRHMRALESAIAGRSVARRSVG